MLAGMHICLLVYTHHVQRINSSTNHFGLPAILCLFIAEYCLVCYHNPWVCSSIYESFVCKPHKWKYWRLIGPLVPILQKIERSHSVDVPFAIKTKRKKQMYQNFKYTMMNPLYTYTKLLVVHIQLYHLLGQVRMVG